MPDVAILVAVFDGLRRDHVTPDRMPRLAAFTGAGSDIRRSRSVFPTATRVNASAFSTGAPGAVNGVIANKYFDPAAFPDRLIDTSDRNALEAAMKASGMPFLAARTLGEEIASHGLTMGVWSAASRGTTYLTHPHAERFGHRRLALHDMAADPRSSPEILDRFGPVPPAGRPNSARSLYLARLLVDTFERGAEPDVSVIWFNDPDMTYHYRGLGSEEARESLRAVDEGFGLLLDAIAARPDADRFQVVAMSDHGQIVARNLIDMKGAFGKAGIRYGKAFGDEVEVVGNVSSTSALRVRDTGALYRVAELLLNQPWVGAVFTAGLGGPTGIVPGTLNKDLLNISHSRAPDLYCVMASDEEVSHGVPGGGPYLSDVPEGGGMHGGLNRHEINNVLALGGSRAKKSFVSDIPGGIVDVAPTILALLGKWPAPSMVGRVWSEALLDGGGEEPEVVETVAESWHNGRVVRLTRNTVGRTSYIAGLETR